MRMVCVFFFKQKTAYELRISDWSSDVCSSDLPRHRTVLPGYGEGWKFKIAIAGGTQGLINRFRIVAEDPSGDRHEQDLPLDARSAERRVGNECVRTCRSRWSPSH